MKEIVFQKQVRKFLESQGALVWRYTADPLTGDNGYPDLHCLYKGTFIGLELKTGTKASPLQLARIEQINNHGGLGVVFTYSLDWQERLLKILGEL